MNILSKIVKNKRIEVEKSKKVSHIDINNLKPPFPIRNFKQSIKRNNRINLITEIKKASPTAGIIRKDFDPIWIAKEYEKAGASAISVLTEKKFFQGDISYLKLAKKEVKIPILRKDFIIDEYQIYESLLFGADAILLIADILSLQKLKKFINITSQYNLSCLVESYAKESLEKSLKAGVEIIGINNRNLRDFKVNLEHTTELIKHIPKDKIVISESGIKSNLDITYLKDIGVDAVLIGETFMKEKDIGSKIEEIMKY